MKRVLIINGSPNGAKGNTEILVNAFAKGVEEKGAIVTRLYTKNLKINPCCGSFYCWTKNPGNCCQKDDMEKVIEAMNNADILALASPVYVDGMTGPLKNLLDRILVRSNPYQIIKDGHSRHNPSKGTKDFEKLVLISNCGFHEMDNFDAILMHAKVIAKHFHCEFAGALLRPHGPALSMLLNEKFSKKMFICSRALASDVLLAAMKAGKELIENGKISEKTEKEISRELFTGRQYRLMVNARFGIERSKRMVKSLFSKKASKNFLEELPSRNINVCVG